MSRCARMLAAGSAFLDVGVERVEHRLEVRHPDGAHVLGHAVHGREEIGLESVEKLHGECYARLRSVRGRCARVLRRPLLLLVRGPRAREEADGLVEGAAEEVRLERLRAVDDALHEIQCVLPLLPVGAQGIVLGVRHVGDHVAGQAVVASRPSGPWRSVPGSPRGWGFQRRRSLHGQAPR